MKLCWKIRFHLLVAIHLPGVLQVIRKISISVVNNSGRCPTATIAISRSRSRAAALGTAAVTTGIIVAFHACCESKLNWIDATLYFPGVLGRAIIFVAHPAQSQVEVRMFWVAVCRDSSHFPISFRSHHVSANT
jgi:hypothetical protein